MDKFNAEEEIGKMGNQIADLIELLGFTGYKNGNWVYSESPPMCTTGLIRPDRSKQPTTRREFTLLLDCLNLEFTKEKIIPEKIIPKKIIPSKIIKKKPRKREN